MLFQVLCGFEPIFYTTHSNEEPIKNIIIDSLAIKIAAFNLFVLQLKGLIFWNILKAMMCR